MSINKAIKLVKTCDDFDMRSPFHCIGGICKRYLAQKDLAKSIGITDAFFTVAKNITGENARKIVFPDEAIQPNPYMATKEQAIRVLEILRDTGVVDWERVMRKE